MNLIKKIYLEFYLFCFVFYLIFNKGVAYTFFVEILWITGILLIIFDRKNYILLYNKKINLLIFFNLIVIFNLIFYINKYSLINLVRDSFVFLYSAFIFIIFLYQNNKNYIWKRLTSFYKLFPFVVLLNFIFQSYVSILDNFSIFGNIPILLYKYGDMGVHLLISTILFVKDSYKIKKNNQILFICLIIFDFLIISSYSRSGMLSFLSGLIIFISIYKLKFQSKVFKRFIISSLITVPLILFIQVKDNFQGRSVGLTQITQNVESVIGNNDNETLENNEIWRLIWWGKIIEYSFSFDNFFTGRGLGISLSQTDEVEANEDLRSPHNFHLTIMARFGVIFFIFWIYWIFIVVKPLFKKQLSDKESILTIFIIAFLINSTFDVYLEGPMGAFPFWTFVGLLFMEDNYKPKDIPT